MEKSEGAFRTIGELSVQLGVKPHILRYWEEQFPMLHPLKRAGGRRHYRPEDVALIEEIHHLLDKEGYTIKGARKFLQGKAPEKIKPAPDTVVDRNEQSSPAVMNALQSIRNRLAEALNTA